MIVLHWFVTVIFFLAILPFMVVGFVGALVLTGLKAGWDLPGIIFKRILP